MRLLSVLAAAAVLSASLAAHAEMMVSQKITANTNSATTYVSTSAFNEFDPSLGVLDSVTLSLSGSASFVGHYAGDQDQLQDVSGVFGGSGGATAGGTGQVNAFQISASGTDTNNLSLFEGTGQTTLNLHFINLTTTSGVSGTLVYNYMAATPVAATPEPSSMALLGTGLLGLAGVVRRRLA